MLSNKIRNKYIAAISASAEITLVPEYIMNHNFRLDGRKLGTKNAVWTTLTDIRGTKNTVFDNFYYRRNRRNVPCHGME